MPDLQFSLTDVEPIQAVRDYLNSSGLLPYRTIRHALDKVKSKDVNSQDAWHLHCTIAFGMDAFLTMDTTLVGQIRSIPNKTMRETRLKYVRIQSELCETLEIPKLTDKELRNLANELGAFPQPQTSE